MIWFIILTTVMTNGDVYTDIRSAIDPKYNNEQSCNDVGKILVEEKQTEVGTSNGKVYFICSSLSEKDFDKATNKTSL